MLLSAVCLPLLLDYNKEEADSLHTMENMHRMLRKLRDYPGVQNAAPLVTFAFRVREGVRIILMHTIHWQVPASISYFIPHTGFFETFGFKTFEGKTLGELDNMDYQRMILLYLLICCRSFRRSAD